MTGSIERILLYTNCPLSVGTNRAAAKNHVGYSRSALIANQLDVAWFRASALENKALGLLLADLRLMGSRIADVGAMSAFGMSDGRVPMRSASSTQKR